MRRTRFAAAALAALAVAPAAARAQTELRAGGIAVMSTRNAAAFDRPGEGSGMLTGFEAMGRYKLVGAAVRVLGGEFGNEQGTVVNGDARLLAGPRIFTFEGGFSKRAFEGQFANQVYSFARAGARSTYSLGSSGLQVNIGAWYYVPLDKGTATSMSGLEGETSLVYFIKQVPAFVQLGYRAEKFDVEYEGAGLRTEAVKGVLLGAGLHLGAR